MLVKKPWKAMLSSLIATGLFSFTTPALCDLVPISPGFSPTTPFTECLLGPRNSGTESLYIPNTTQNPLLAVNPGDTDEMVAIFSQGAGFQDINNILSSSGNATVAFSKDGGKTWDHKLLPFNFCAGGDVSDQIRVQALRFSPHGGSHGTVMLIGTSQDVRDTLHNPSIGSIFVATSKDLGKSWSGPTILATGPSFNSFESQGPTVQGGDAIFDSFDGDNAYATWSTVIAPSSFFGDIFFSRTTNLGKSWKDTQKIYSLVNDFPNSAFAPQGVGQCIAPALVEIKRNGTKVLIDAFLRIYPNNNTCYAQNLGCSNCGVDPSGNACSPTLPDSIYDRAIVRSVNEGKTWEEHATVIAPSIFANSFDPRSPSASGILSFDNALGTALAVDEKRNILYAVWQAGHECPNTNLQLQPQIYLSLSKDLGSTWTTPVVVSQTTAFLGQGNCPDQVNPADQAFNGNVVVTKDGLVVVTYYDFRFFEPYSCFVPTDFWMAVYRPVDGPGTTGVGLDFVQEKRLTPQSFDSGPLYTYPVKKSFYENYCCNPIDACSTFPCNLPTSVLQGIGASTGLCSHHENVYTVFAAGDVGFNADLVSIGLPCGGVPPGLEVKSASHLTKQILQQGECCCFENNSSTRPCSLIDANRYIDCLYDLVDLSDLD